MPNNTEELIEQVRIMVEALQILSKLRNGNNLEIVKVTLIAQRALKRVGIKP